MAILEQIQQMKQQGMNDQDIVASLQKQGISPSQINEALDQSQIKSAVTREDPTGNPPAPNQQTQEEYAPQNQEYQTTQQGYEQQPQEYYQQEGYETGRGYSGGMDSDMIIEISEQVFAEKIKDIQKKVDEMSEFKSLAETKIENIDNRLKRIETSLDKLQITILDKVGSYGDNLNAIKKEMSMMQDSFGKVVNQAVKGKKHSTPKTKKKIPKK